MRKYQNHEEVEWRQRSRDLWLKKGDRSIKVFHSTANAHKRYNNIDKLEIEGAIVENEANIKEDMVSLYQKLYIEEEKWRPQGDLRDCPKINDVENQMLQGVPNLVQRTKPLAQTGHKHRSSGCYSELLSSRNFGKKLQCHFHCINT